MLLSLFNNLNKVGQEIRKRRWKREENRGLEVCKKTIGIIGFGMTGSNLAKLLRGFDVKILAYDKYIKKHSYQSSMQKIYTESDIVSLHIPLTNKTRYLVNDKFINKFKKPIYLINTSRGKCINTKSLIKALENKKISGACLDVLEYEKDSFEKLAKKGKTTEMDYLIESNKIILSPHIAGWTKESNLRIANILFKKITACFAQ